MNGGDGMLGIHNAQDFVKPQAVEIEPKKPKAGRQGRQKQDIHNGEFFWNGWLIHKILYLIVIRGGIMVLAFLFFFASGFCGLLYQLVWLRLTYGHYGVITPNLSVVLSVFMGGLGLGAWGAGRFLASLKARTGVSSLRL
jgi:hypothetical protein